MEVWDQRVMQAIVALQDTENEIQSSDELYKLQDDIVQTMIEEGYDCTWHPELVKVREFYDSLQALGVLAQVLDQLEDRDNDEDAGS